MSHHQTLGSSAPILPPIKMGSIKLVDLITSLLLSVLAALALRKIPLVTKLRSLGGKREQERWVKRDTGTRDFLKKMKEADKNCVVFFGSQTGMSEDLASRLAKEAHSRFGLRALLCNIEDYDYDNLDSFPEDHVAMFVMSTFGEGEPTDSAVNFYDFITAEDVAFENASPGTKRPLKSLKYVAFGLGNSAYEHYNAVSRRVDEALQKLGARRLGDLGQGDDGERRVEEDFMTWKEQTWSILCKEMGLVEREPVYEPSFEILERPDLAPTSDVVFLGEPNRARLEGVLKGPYNAKNPFPAKVLSSRDLFSTGPRRCLHIDVDLSGSGLTYETGDHILVAPVNDPSEVDRFLRVFGLLSKRDAVIDIKKHDKTASMPFPVPTTFDAAVRYYLEICAPVSRQFLQLLVQFAPNEASKAKLSKIATDKEDFQRHVAQRCLNLAQTLEMISDSTTWSGVPFAVLAEGLLATQPRPYSISSSSLVNNEKVSITAVVESFPIEGTSDNFKGVTTNYLLAMHEESGGTGQLSQHTAPYKTKIPRDRSVNASIPVFLRTSNFKLPENPATPIVMIGPGTGVAPFRGFLLERAAQKQAGRTVGKAILFYGCRKRTEDFIYQDEWKAVQKILGEDFTLVVAFSREGKKKTYVQDKLLECAKAVHDLVVEGAHIYICGSATMARENVTVLGNLIARERNISAQDGAQFIKDMRSSGRFQEDTW